MSAWHVDLSTSYVTHFPSDVGFDIGFKPVDFDSDDVLSERDYIATPIHFSPWGNVPDEATLARLCHAAVRVYCRKLREREACRLLRVVGLRRSRKLTDKAA